MWLSYNGILLQMERIVRWDQTPIYSEDGADYLYTHHRLVVQCVFNPKATSTASLVGFPPGLTGLAAPGSLRILRSLLLQPRRLLRVIMARTIVLESPAVQPGKFAYFETDARNGPHPLGCDIIEFHGEKTAIVVFAIETWVNDCNFPGNVPLLSHRWEESQEIDELNYTTRVISGTAIFRSDILKYADTGQGVKWLQPDDFRAALAGGHPIPDNFKRERVVVQQSSDGLSLRYTLVDVEQPVNLGQDNPVMKIEATWRSGFDWSHFSLLDPRTWTQASVFTAIVAKVWGRRTTTRQELINAALRVTAAFGFTSPTSAVGGMFAKAGIAVDLVHRHVDLEVGIYTSGWVNRTVSGLLTPQVSSIYGGIIQNFPEVIANVTTVTDKTNPRPPADGVRGTWLGRMVAQAMGGDICQPPKSVTELKAVQPDTITLRAGYTPPTTITLVGGVGPGTIPSTPTTTELTAKLPPTSS